MKLSKIMDLIYKYQSSVCVKKWTNQLIASEWAHQHGQHIFINLILMVERLQHASQMMKRQSTICILKYMFVSSIKLKAVDLAEKSNSAASHKFRVSKKLVRDWQKQSDKKKDLPKTKCADRLCNFLY